MGVVVFGFLTTQQAADALGVSTSRIRQMVAAERIPAPVALGGRLQLFRRADIEAVQGGEVTSGVAALLGPAAAPLTLTHDVVWPFRASVDGEPYPVHTRIYTGVGRTVVIVSEPGPPDAFRIVTNRFEHVIEEIQQRYLSQVGGADITWVQLTPNHSRGGPGTTVIDNVIVRRGHDGLPRVEWGAPAWSPMTWDDLTALIGGAALDIYDWAHYTEQVVSDHQRTGRPVPVVDDPHGLSRYADSLQVFLATPHPDAPVAVAALAVELNLRLTITPREHDQDRVNTILRRPYRLPVDVQAVLADHDPEDPPAFERAEADLHRLLAWRESVDAYANHPDPTLAAHLTAAITAQSDVLVLAHPDGAPPPRLPDFLLRDVHLTDGSWDQAYLESIAWLPEKAAATRPTRLLTTGLVPGTTTRLGCDPHGNHVCYLPTDQTLRVLWPTRHDHPLPGDVHVAADPGGGDRPAYLTRRGAIIGLLPRTRHDTWSFGYSGGSPASLSYSIETLLEEDGRHLLDRDREWIAREVITGRHELNLDLSTFLTP